MADITAPPPLAPVQPGATPPGARAFPPGPPPVAGAAPNGARPNALAAAAAGVPSPPVLSDKTFRLARPVNRMDMHSRQMEPAGEITLRLPTSLDLFEVGGLPTRTLWSDGGMSVEMNVDRLKAWTVRLSGWDTPSVYQLAAKDQRAIYEWLNEELAATEGN